MLKTIEDLSATKKRLLLEIPAEVVEKEIADAIRNLQAKLKLPGFRPGKVPVSLIERRFGKDVEAEAVERLISHSYQEAVKEAGIVPVTAPVVEEASEFKRNAPMKMTLTVEVRPRIENLIYEGIAVKDIPVKVTDEDVEDFLKRLQEERTVYEPYEGEIASGDVAIIGLKTLTKGGEPFELEEQLLKIGTDYLPKEISEALIGRRKKDELKVMAKFPEGFHMPEVAGTESEVSISVKEVKKAVPPEIDDEFAKDIGFDNLEALKNYVRENIINAKKEAVKKIQKAEIVKKILEANDFEVPESLLERELGHLVDEARVKAGDSPFDPEAAKAELRPLAVRNIKTSLLIDMIGEKENVTVTEKDMMQVLSELSKRLRLSVENVMKLFIAKDGSLDGLRHSVFEDKVLNILYEKAKIEPPEPEAETL